MRKNLSFVIAVISCLFLYQKSYSQFTSAINIYSGYGQTLYNMEGYDSKGFVPVGFRVAAGVYGFQFGVDYCKNVMDQKFEITDPMDNTPWYTETIHDDYVGGMLRIFMGDDPLDFAVVVRGEVGYYMSERKVEYTPDYLTLHPDKASGTYKFSNSMAYNVSVGVSIPISESAFHITMEGQFNYNPRKYDNTKNYYTTLCFQAGLSYNLFQGYNLGKYERINKRRRR